MNYWLMKSEPHVFGLRDLEGAPDGTSAWDGVRNYQARNYIRDRMRPGDLAFFYHSSCAQPGIAGIMEIVSRAYPDPTALDPASDHFDPMSHPGVPRWYAVDVRYRRDLKRYITLAELKQCLELEPMPLLRPGNRLSVMPVTAAQWRHILALE